MLLRNPPPFTRKKKGESPGTPTLPTVSIECCCSQVLIELGDGSGECVRLVQQLLIDESFLGAEIEELQKIIA